MDRDLSWWMVVYCWFEDVVLDTLAISQRISPKEVVSIQSESDYRSTPASLVDTGLLGHRPQINPIHVIKPM
jgi:hypothetical protein